MIFILMWLISLLLTVMLIYLSDRFIIHKRYGWLAFIIVLLIIILLMIATPLWQTLIGGK